MRGFCFAKALLAEWKAERREELGLGKWLLALGKSANGEEL